MGLIYYHEDRDDQIAKARAAAARAAAVRKAVVLPATPAAPVAPAPRAALPSESKGCFSAFKHFLDTFGKKEAASEPLLEHS